MTSRFERRIPTEMQIVDALHMAAAEFDNANGDCTAVAARRLTPPGADDATREAIIGEVSRVWSVRFKVWGA